MFWNYCTGFCGSLYFDLVTSSLSNSSSFSQAEVENQGRHSFLPPPPGGSQNLLPSGGASPYLKPAFPLPPPSQSSYLLGFPSFPPSYASQPHDSKLTTHPGHSPRSTPQGRPSSASSFSNPHPASHNVPVDLALTQQQAIPRLFSPNSNLSNPRPNSREYNKPPITSSWPSVFDPLLRGVGEGEGGEEKRSLGKRRGSDVGTTEEATLQPGEGGREWKRVLTRA